MSIDEKINLLKLQKEKIKAYQKIYKYCSKLETTSVKSDIVSEVTKSIKSFVDARIKDIEQFQDTSSVFTTFSGDDLKVLKAVISKVAAKGTAMKVNPVTPITPIKDQPKEPKKESSKKVVFALKHRHLEGKRINAKTVEGLDIEGTVVGLDEPFVVIKDKDGNKKLVDANTIQEVGI